LTKKGEKRTRGGSAPLCWKKKRRRRKYAFKEDPETISQLNKGKCSIRKNKGTKKFRERGEKGRRYGRVTKGKRTLVIFGKHGGYFMKRGAKVTRNVCNGTLPLRQTNSRNHHQLYYWGFRFLRDIRWGGRELVWGSLEGVRGERACQRVLREKGAICFDAGGGRR